MNKKIMLGCVLVVLAVLAFGIVTNEKRKNRERVIHPELVSRYPALKDNGYLRGKSVSANMETETRVCDEQRVFTYINDPRTSRKWQSVYVVDCGPIYYISDIRSDLPEKLFGPFDR